MPPALEDFNAGLAPINQQAVKVENTAELIKEFEHVYDSYTQLTPPQSPPQSNNVGFTDVSDYH